MTDSVDAFWDELGVAWRAIDPDVSVITSRLAIRLRWQSRWITAGLLFGLPLCAAAGLLGVRTIVIGLFSGTWFFVVRGIAIVGISAILIAAWSSLLSVRSGEGGRALSEMIDLAIGRAQTTLSLVRAGLYVCVIAAVFGTVGTSIRIHVARPPRLSPIVDLVVLVLIALVLLLYGRQVRAELGRYRVVRQALAVDGEG
jgi:hypothetical protein